MSDDYQYISPFALSDGTDGPQFTNASGTTIITEVTIPSIVCLAGNPMDKALPATNLISVISDSRKILAVAPDQWLLTDTEMSPEDLLVQIPQQYLRKTVVCADHSHAWSILRLTGVNAEKCLSRLCPIDLHYDVFGENNLLQTNMAGIYILCFRIEGKNGFDLYMSHSYSRSFFEILRDAVNLD